MECPRCESRDVFRSRLKHGVERFIIWRLIFQPVRCRTCDHRFRQVKHQWVVLALLIFFLVATLFVAAHLLDRSRRIEKQVDQPNTPI